MTKIVEGSVTFDGRSMPARVFRLFGDIKVRMPESEEVYRCGKSEQVGAVMRRIFPRELPDGVQKVYVEIGKANGRLSRGGVDFDGLDEKTVEQVSVGVSMAFRTSHPLASADLKHTMRGVVGEVQGDELSIVDIGCGPGTLTMTSREIARRSHGGVSTKGVDSSGVHIEMARFLYPSERHSGLSWEQTDARGGVPRAMIGTALDVGHHLNESEYEELLTAMVESCDHVVLSDPTRRRAARLIVGNITRDDPVHDQAVESYDAAHSAGTLMRICRDVADATGAEIRIVDTGFMHITTIKRR